MTLTEAGTSSGFADRARQFRDCQDDALLIGLASPLQSRAQARHR